MALLGEFTVAELMERAQVSEATARTALRRVEGALEVVGHERTGRRGGAIKHYRVTADGAEILRTRLAGYEHPGNRLVTALPGQSDMDAVGTPHPSRLPASLLAAEQILLHRFPETKDRSAQRSLLRSAWASYRDAGATLDDDPDAAPPGADVHRRATELLLAAAICEFVETPPTTAFRQVALMARELAHAEVGEPEQPLVAEAVRRAFGSVPAPERRALVVSAIPASEDRLTATVVEVLRAGGQHVPLERPWSDDAADLLGGAGLGLRILTVGKAKRDWQPVLETVLARGEHQLNDLIVVASGYNKDLASAVFQHHGLYVPVTDTDALAGALLSRAPTLNLESLTAMAFSDPAAPGERARERELFEWEKTRAEVV
jgi:hypothetical protein